MNEIRYRPIGTVHSPFKEPLGTPIQPGAARDIDGTVEVFEEFAEGLKDLDGFSHVILIYHFHLSGEPSLEVEPFLDDQAHGVFSTRAPNRPNPVGISVVRLVGTLGNTLQIRDVDIVDGTPLLDIKPYVPEFDGGDVTKKGWLEENLRRLPTRKDDGRFVE
ncbi:MAG: tRNA (N6-threonylcarbamoyladenosine(37)-N6)-methyltransferase TrmO [Gemmatimonadota bacterium]|jgi:tRNA-Thr(GGU) m(6)t(6)A37 methyltransferase TsaA